MGSPSARYLRSKGAAAEIMPVACFRHPNPKRFIEIPRCQAATQDGTQCKNMTSRWDFCFQHRAAKELDDG